MTLPGSGPYEITNFNEEKRVGRSLHETTDLSPKAVFVGTNDPHPIWDVKKLHNGRYILSARGDPTTSIHEKVFALLKHQYKMTEWELHPRGEGAFIVENDKGLVWTERHDEEGHRNQLIVAPREEGNKHQLFKVFWLD